MLGLIFTLKKKKGNCGAVNAQAAVAAALPGAARSLTLYLHQVANQLRILPLVLNYPANRATG